MNVMRIYTNNRKQVLSWAKVYIAAGFKVRAVERWGQNGRPGHSKFMLEIYNPGIDRSEFENKVNEIWNNKIR